MREANGRRNKTYIEQPEEQATACKASNNYSRGSYRCFDRLMLIRPRYPIVGRNASRRSVCKTRYFHGSRAPALDDNSFLLAPRARSPFTLLPVRGRAINGTILIRASVPLRNPDFRNVATSTTTAGGMAPLIDGRSARARLGLDR